MDDLMCSGCGEYAGTHISDRIEALEAQVATAISALKECMTDLDRYSQYEYPSDHPVHARYRQRDYDSNPARIALASLTDTPAPDPVQEAARVLLGDGQAVADIAIDQMRANKVKNGKRIGYIPALEIALRAIAEGDTGDK